eukprot:1049771-Prymnesium_polylepis.1
MAIAGRARQGVVAPLGCAPRKRLRRSAPEHRGNTVQRAAAAKRAPDANHTRAGTQHRGGGAAAACAHRVGARAGGIDTNGRHLSTGRHK